VRGGIDTAGEDCSVGSGVLVLVKADKAGTGVSVADGVALGRGVRVGVGVRVGPNVGKGRSVAVGPIGRGVAVGALHAVNAASNVASITINLTRMNYHHYRK
jgi:hypothetical protein